MMRSITRWYPQKKYKLRLDTIHSENTTWLCYISPLPFDFGGIICSQYLQLFLLAPVLVNAYSPANIGPKNLKKIVFHMVSLLARQNLPSVCKPRMLTGVQHLSRICRICKILWKMKQIADKHRLTNWITRTGKLTAPHDIMGIQPGPRATRYTGSTSPRHSIYQTIMTSQHRLWLALRGWWNRLILARCSPQLFRVV